MEKRIIAILDSGRDFINDLIENTEYMVVIETFDDMGSFGYFASQVNRGMSTSIDCMLYDKQLKQQKNALIEFDGYDEEIRVYVKWYHLTYT